MKLQKRHRMNKQNGQIDLQLHNQLKKHNNYCNRIIKKVVRKKNGKKIKKGKQCTGNLELYQ